MSKRTLNQEQINELLINKHILRCSEKSITYDPEFKLLATLRYQKEGLSPSSIFLEAGFNLAIIGSETPKQCLRRWLKTFRKKGPDGLRLEGRGQSGSGGRPKNPDNLTEKERLKYLETENAYLKAENAFLAKLRKQR